MEFDIFKSQLILAVLVLLFIPTAYSDAETKVDILHYDLDVTVLPQERAMKVVARFDFENPVADRIELSLNEAMDVEIVELNNERTDYERKGSILSVPLNARGSQTITVRYSSSRPEIHFGDLLVGYLGGPKETTYMVYRASWYPMIFGDRATAVVRITVPEGYTPITVGENIGTSGLDGVKTYSWKTDGTAPGVSFAAGEFEERTATAYITKEDGGLSIDDAQQGWNNNKGIQFIEISCYLTPRDAPLADNCISKSERVLKYYARLFGGYPYQKFSVIEMPEDFFGGHGAMGLIMIHPSALRGGNDELLAHEIAHNWWGALISVKRGYNLQSLGSPNIKMGEATASNDLWLHEGMATYSSILFLEKTHGKASLESSLHQKLSEYLNSGGRSSISSASEDYTQGTYHATVYSKGALVLHMLRYVMGDEAFSRLMESYAQKYAGTSVESKDFEILAEAVQGEDLKWFFDEWIRGQGLPDYSVDSVTVERENSVYVTRVSLSQKGDIVNMPIDVTLTTADKTLKKRVFVEGERVEVVFESADEPNYVELDEEGWLLEESRANNLYVLNYPLSPSGARLAWRRLWDNRILSALKQAVVP